VLGHGYSGATLLGLALGTHAAVRNLGEVVNLEHAYHKNAQCSCGLKVVNCPVWQGLKNHIENRQLNINEIERWALSEAGKREAFDDRGGGINKIKMVLGKSLSSLFGEEYLKQYARKNTDFFARAFEYFGADVIIDLSKSPERLEVLLKHSNLEIYCLYLIRDPNEVYASNLKRPKQTRSKYGFKSIRESIWFRLRTNSYNRAFRKNQPSNRMILNWEDFTKSPVKKLNEICDWLDIDKFTEEKMVINRLDQHNYTGNRWLHRNAEETITISERVSNKKLNKFEKFTFRLFNSKNYPE
jgi:hypothetical protein